MRLTRQHVATEPCFRCGQAVPTDDECRYLLIRVDPHTRQGRRLTTDEHEELRERRQQGESLLSLGRLGYRLGVVCDTCAEETAIPDAVSAA